MRLTEVLKPLMESFKDAANALVKKAQPVHSEEEVRKLISDFKEMKQRLPAPEKDISYWVKKPFSEFYLFVKEKSLEKTKGEKRREIKADENYIDVYENEYFEVKIPLTTKAACNVGVMGNWCVSTRDNEENQFRNYSEEGKVYFIAMPMQHGEVEANDAIITFSPDNPIAIEVYHDGSIKVWDGDNESYNQFMPVVQNLLNDYLERDQEFFAREAEKYREDIIENVQNEDDEDSILLKELIETQAFDKIVDHGKYYDEMDYGGVEENFSFGPLADHIQEKNYFHEYMTVAHHVIMNEVTSGAMSTRQYIYLGRFLGLFIHDLPTTKILDSISGHIAKDIRNEDADEDVVLGIASGIHDEWNLLGAGGQETLVTWLKETLIMEALVAFRERWYRGGYAAYEDALRLCSLLIKDDIYDIRHFRWKEIFIEHFIKGKINEDPSDEKNILEAAQDYESSELGDPEERMQEKVVALLQKRKDYGASNHRQEKMHFEASILYKDSAGFRVIQVLDVDAFIKDYQIDGELYKTLERERITSPDAYFVTHEEEVLYYIIASKTKFKVLSHDAGVLSSSKKQRLSEIEAYNRFAVDLIKNATSQEMIYSMFIETGLKNIPDELIENKLAVLLRTNTSRPDLVTFMTLSRYLYEDHRLSSKWMGKFINHLYHVQSKAFAENQMGVIVNLYNKGHIAKDKLNTVVKYVPKDVVPDEAL